MIPDWAASSYCSLQRNNPPLEFELQVIVPSIIFDLQSPSQGL